MSDAVATTVALSAVSAVVAFVVGYLLGCVATHDRIETKERAIRREDYERTRSRHSWEQ
jgi:hypothetical protein